MDWEVPVDGWYVWLAVSIVSVAIAGIALGVPTGPPPDANQGANAIEETAGSSYAASSTYDHDATAVKFDGRTIAMRNEHGTARASLSYGHVVPVMGHERLENLSEGRSFADEYAAELERTDENAIDVFLEDVDDAYADNAGEWRTADGQLRTRSISTTPVPTIRAAVDIEENSGTTHNVLFTYEANTDIPLSFELTDETGHGCFCKAVEATPTRDSDPLQLDDIRDHSSLQFPIDAKIHVAGDTLCTRTIQADQGDETVSLCSPGGETVDTAGDSPGYVTRKTETESFHVTLVDV